MDAESQLLAEKDAEIERLREENAHFAWRDQGKNRLITELADALAESGYYAGEGSLIARARKATE